MHPQQDEAAGLRQFGADYTVRKLEANRSRESIEAAVNKLHAMSSAQGPISPQCVACRSRNFPAAILSELLPIQRMLSQLPDTARGELRERAACYAEATLPFRDGRLHLARPDCPFYLEGRCVLGEARPFGCRLGQGDQADARTAALGMGHMMGLYLAGLDHRQVELGLALPGMLGEPDWIDGYCAGKSVLWEAAIIPPERDPVVELGKSILRRREPSGFPPALPSVAECQRVLRESDFEKAIHVLQGSSPLEQFYRIQVPYAYNSEDEITEWESYFVRTMREVAQMRFDPADAFDALKARPIYALAYHGRDVKEILAEHGRTIIEPVIAAALPDLVRPIEGRRTPGRIRVGYLSRNVRRNSASIWSLGWIRNHGPDIESFVFSTHDIQDAYNVRFREVADHYYHVPGDVPATARFIKSLDLDVLIYTDIGQVSWNYMYAGMRLARVQCTAWGFPITSGLSTIDYYLSSELMEPEDGENHYVEKLVRLPGSGIVYDRPECPPITKTRADFGLPSGFLVGMLQNLMKCVPRWDSLFAQVNEATGAKIVFVEHNNRAVTEKVKRRFQKAGIEALWLPRMEPEEFHQLLGQFDLLIDPPAWSGGITTLDTIPLGKSIVTLPCEFMRSRLSLAFMNQAGMQDLVANSPERFAQLTADRELQRSVVEQADLNGPYGDPTPIGALNEWLLGVSRGN